MKLIKQQRLAILYRASVGALVAVLFVVSAMAGQAASPPNLITYQGRLLDSNGVPVTSSSTTMIFELYTDPTAGSCVWSNSSVSCVTATSRTVTLTDGLFSENLGDTSVATPYAAIGDSIFADNASLYLKVTVGGEALSPRKQLTSAPYALNSETLDGLNSSSSGGTNSFVPVTSSTGNLTLTGTPSGTGVGAGSMYINPASVTAGHTIFGVANNTTEVFRVNSDGDTSITGGITLSDASEVMTFGNAETVNNISDGSIIFTGNGGSNDVDLSIVLDGTFPTISSNLGTGVGIIGNLLFGADNLFSIGTASANRPSSVYAATSMVVAGTTTLSNSFLDSTATLSLNAANNQEIRTGTGVFTAGGDVTIAGTLSANGVVTLGDSAADLITMTGTIQGATPFTFEGSTANDYETMFALPNPTAADNTITFQNGSGTLAFTSDIPSGASLWEVGTNGSYEDDAAVIVGSDAAFSYVSTAAASDLRVGDDFEAIDDGFFGSDLVVGASTSATETLSHAGFSLSGNDLFVSDSLGIEGALFTDGGFTQGDADADSVTFYGNAIGFAGSAPILNSASAALGINTTNNQTINTGTGTLTAGGDLAVTGVLFANGQVYLGNAGSDFVTVSGTIQGAMPFTFEGATANDYETMFALPNPTAADNTITFQNGSGTLAFTSDIPSGASLWEVGTNGSYEDDAAVIVGSDAAFSYVSTAGASDFRVGDDFEVVDDGFFGSDLVVGASTSAVDTINDVNFTLGGNDLFVAGDTGLEGSLFIDGGNIYSTTSSLEFLIMDSAVPAFSVTQGTSRYLAIDTNSEIISFGNTTTNPTFKTLGTGNFATADDLIVGGTPSTAETISHAGFSLSGNDLFVSDSLGIEGALFTDGGFTQGDADADSVTFYGNAIGFAGSAPILNSASAALGINTTNNQAINTGSGLLTAGGSLTVNGTAITLGGNSTIIDMTGTGTLGINTTTNRNIATGTGSFDMGGHLAVGGNASISTKQVLTVQENIDCSTGCYGVYAPVTNTGGSMAADSYGGDFRLTSAVGPSINLSQIGLSGVAIPSGVATYSGTVTGVQGQIAPTAASTLTDAFGVRGLVSLNNLTDVTSRVAGISGTITSSNSGTFSGVVDAVFGNFSPTAGTYNEVNGVDLNIEGVTGTTMNTARGVLVNLDPVTGIFNPSNIHSGAQITIDGDNGSGNDASVYGANITATSSTTGTTSAYGVRSTASGADTNYSGYFYGSMFQVDADATPDTNNALSSGAGDIYVTGNAEVDGNMRVDGGLIRLAGSGNILFDAATSGTDKYAGLSLAAADGGGAGGDWQMYTLGGATTMVSLGNRDDLRWTVDGGYNNNTDVMRLTAAGALLVDGAMTASAYNTAAGQADLAEVYEVADPTIVAGEILSMNISGEIVRASFSGGELLGVVSTSPGYLLNGSIDELAPNERMIALAGRVPVKVNLEGGEIVAGDPITISSTAGEGMKANGVGEIIGFALEPYVGGGAPIEVLINLQWHPGDKISADGDAVGVNSNLVINSLSDATASNMMDSESLVLRGSAFDVVASDRDFSLNTVVASATDYRLSIKNVSDAEVAYVDQDGAFSVAGDVIVGDHLYPSDRGAAQTNRYIFYDGSAGPGGDFMRTNAAGWATGSYDFAEMFPSDDILEPGDVVVFGSKKESVAKSSSSKSSKVAGVVSTRPGFLAGENKLGNYPIALAGRVPTKVSNENGEIKIGDPLTTSSITGVAMKADSAGMILGYALEDFSNVSGTATVFINVTYWNGLDSNTQPKNSASGLGGMSLSGLDVSGTVYIGANDILNVGSISGMNMRWEIAENGDFKTRGLITTAIEAYNGEIMETYATTATEVYITMAGTVVLEEGKASVNLVKEDPKFNAVVSNMVPLRVIATPHEPISVYVANKTSSSFDIVQINGAMNGVEVDWYVVGVRKDFEPKEYLELEEEATEGRPEPAEGSLPIEVVEVVEGIEEGQDVDLEPEPVVVLDQEIVEVVEAEPASDVSAPPESQQIAVESISEDVQPTAETSLAEDSAE